MKAIFDTLISFTCLIILMPVFIGVSALILIFDGLPILFVQERSGLHRVKFQVLKFRTMRNNEVTHIGRMLRATGIDESTQLLNVLRGEMSLVGPRPLTVEDVRRLGWDTRDHDIRWSVKPGITGQAQLSMVCDADVTWEQDCDYIRNRNLVLDTKILVMTLAKVVVGRKPLKNAVIKADQS